MIKAKYLKWQADTLQNSPLQPQELGKDGLSHIRKNALISIVSFAVLATSILLLVRGLTGSFNPDISAGLRLVVMAGIFALLWVSLSIFDKSSDVTIKSGLYWRISVDDKLQDEWEVTQKHRAQSMSFEWVMWGLVGLFCAWLVIRLIEMISGISLLFVPSFGVSIVMALTLLYGLSLLPLIYTCSTIEPMSEQDLAELIAEREEPIIAEEEGENDNTPLPLSVAEKWKARLKSWSPFIIGGLIGLTWVMRRDSEKGFFYEAGYEIGNWIGRLFSGG